MGSEILAIPDEALEDVIYIIRAGLACSFDIDNNVYQNLDKWCCEMEVYLQELKENIEK